MTDRRPRWEQDVERVRQRGPAWLDADRFPWWLWVVFAAGFAGWGTYLLFDANNLWERVIALGLMILPPSGALIGARRRRRGESFFGPGS